MTLLQCNALDITIGSTHVCTKLDLNMYAGEAWAVLGRNGSGKTTLLHTLAGLRSAEHGTIKLNNKPMHELGRQQIARQLGMLFQQYEDTFPSTVLESTLIGRHPYLGWTQWESSTDIQLAEQALSKLGLLALKDRDIHSLSGGERRRVSIACLLTQDPDIALLDEPDNHLDIHHQIESLTILRQQFENKLLFMSAHDVNLAARFCTHALLLFGDGNTLCGPFEQVVTLKNLKRLYAIDMQTIDNNGQTIYYPT